MHSRCHKKTAHEKGMVVERVKVQNDGIVRQKCHFVNGRNKVWPSSK